MGWLTPSIIRKRVVFPAPFAPTNPTRPAGTSTSSPSTAVTAGYRLVRPLVRSSAGALDMGAVCQEMSSWLAARSILGRQTGKSVGLACNADR